MIIQSIPSDPYYLPALIGCIVLSVFIGIVVAYKDKNHIEL